MGEMQVVVKVGLKVACPTLAPGHTEGKRGRRMRNVQG